MILSENTRRVRRARVSLTDFLDQEQAAALKAFAGCQTNAITRSCPGDCRSNKYRYGIIMEYRYGNHAFLV